MQPIPAAVTAWRKILSLTSPAANTPGTPVSVESGRATTYPSAVERQLPGHEAGHRRVPDRDENAVAGVLAHRTRAHIAQPHAGHLRRLGLAQDLFDDAVPDDVDLGVAEQPILQDLFGPERVAAMNQGRLRRAWFVR